MNELKEQFKTWLKEKGLKDTTVYEYVRRLDRLGIKLYRSKRKHWTQIEKHIFPLKVIHDFYNKKSNNNVKPDVVCNTIRLQMYYSGQENCITEKDCKCFMTYIRWSKKHHAELHKTKSALDQFYLFLHSLKEELDTNGSIHKQQESNKIYNTIDIPLLKDLDTIEENFPLFPSYLQFLLKFNFPSPDGPGSLEGYTGRINIKTLADLLGVSADTLPRLKSYPDFNLDCYTCQQDDVNAYMQAHYHKATKPLVEVSGSSTDNKQNWLTAKEAASRMGCSMSAIKKLRREGKLSYTQNSPMSFRYCPEEINAIKVRAYTKKKS